GHPMFAIQAATAAQAMFHPMAGVADPKENWAAVVRLIASLPTVVAAFHRLRQGHEVIDPRSDLDHAGNFYWMLFGEEPSPAVRKVLDACLIIHAEHSMNASTFTARVTGSALAVPYAVVSAAIGTLSGPLHGGANEEALEMLQSIGTVANVRPWLVAKLKADPKYKLMGFGHRVYKVKDPRASVLQEFAERAFAEGSRPALYDAALELERVAAGDEFEYTKKGVFPNVDFFSGSLDPSLRIPTLLFTPVFAVARVAGWLAHW